MLQGAKLSEETSNTYRSLLGKSLESWLFTNPRCSAHAMLCYGYTDNEII